MLLNPLPRSLILVCFFLLFTSCQPDRSDRQTASLVIDVQPSLRLDKNTTPGNSILRITYSWKTGASFQPFDTEMLAKVHFTNENGNILWQDDHQIEPSALKWVADGVYEYDRIVYVPLITRNTTVSVNMGLYSQASGKKFVLQSNAETGKDKIRVAELPVTPPKSPDDLPEARIRYDNGWFQLEKNASTNTSWRWISDKATLILKNPGRDAELYIKGWVPTSILKSNSKLTILHGDSILNTSEDLQNNFAVLIDVNEDLFNGKPEIELNLMVEPSYVPNEVSNTSDTRRLASMIYVCYFN